MACTVAARSPLLRNPTVRRYAAAAAAQPAASVAPEVRVLDNNVTVATVDTNSPIAQVSIVFRAGSRNETYDNQGTVHHLRIAAGLGTSRASAFGITRNVQQLGGNLTATVDRESIAYTLQITRNNLEPALVFLEDVATRQVFKPWEVSDQIPRLRYELSTIPETSRVLELLHKAAYRTGLGYSLYSPKRQLGKISTETLQHFVQTWFTGSRCAVVGTGVAHSELANFASTLNVSFGEGPNEASRYYGGELRKERSSPLATVALAVEGAGWKNEKDALACAILQRALGTGPRVKWGGCASPVYRDAAAAAGNDPFALSSLNVSYTDSGLLGFVLCSPPNIAGSLTKTAYKWLKSPKLSDADISRGKAILKTEVLCAADNCTEMLESLQREIVLKGSKVTSPEAIASEIDNVSASQVSTVAGRIANGKVSLAAIGDLSTVPYVDQLN